MKRVFLALVFTLCACAPSGKGEASSEGSSASRLFMSSSDKGVPQWALVAGSAALFDRSDLLLMNVPELSLYEDGRKSSEISADKAEMDTSTKKTKLTGNVKLFSSGDNIHLATTELFYDPSGKKIYTPGNVVITRDTTVITGKNFSASSDMSRAEIRENVVVDEKKEKIHMLTTNLIFDTAAQKIYTEDDVLINTPETVIRGRGLSADTELTEIEIKHQETRVVAE